ncbi:class I SAM-dependent DNA methyltransferase [uncultured Muribaculum sp.]|uniref:type I restriction-modification system subunit M n=1 Tax=uncultured Muribaculum sp. TaxID=1918613 RepID=UPI00272F3D5A|nr:class I SAM-dependent DNA methyltransferase [uncultured Muribaculum sp.]
MEQNNKRPDISFVWRITDDVLRDTFKKNEIGEVMLPFVVIRRIDCILAPVNAKVQAAYTNFKDKVADDKLDPILRKATGGMKFYNTSRHTLTSLLDDSKNIGINFDNYLNGFSPEVKEILRNFQFDKVVARLTRNGLLYQMLQAVAALDFSPEKYDNHDMGYVFEELIRISNEQSNETAGEHFTPRDVIRLMSAILFTPDKEILNKRGIIRTIFDPTCGSGGMMNLGRQFILDMCDRETRPTIQTFGQELNEQTYAIAKSEALITGEDPRNIRLGNSLSNDQFQSNRFNYIMANPPYGVTWKKDQAFVLNESLDPNGRFSAGTPRISDGQLLFLQHMISKMDSDGTRIGVVTNGSPLFSGGAGSGESNIRKWIIENDWLEAIVALPKDLFYNVGIQTYLWFLTNKKSPERKGKVQLINAADICHPAKKSLGNKRNDILEEDVERILQLYLEFEENDNCHIFSNKFFGSYELTVCQPKRDTDGNLVLKKGDKQADKTDTETIAIGSDWKEYFATEVLPHIDPESWVDISKTKVSYEINISRYFYKPEQLRPTTEIAADIRTRERHIANLISQLFD